MMPWWRRAVLALPLLAGCAYSRSAEVPMPRVEHTPLGPARARGVMVLLPGIHDGPADFVEEGFVSVLQGAGYDAVAADAHIGYFRSRTIVERLDADVVQPLRRQRYGQLWLAGVSLGGLSALAQGQHHGDGVTGILAIAPFSLSPKFVGGSSLIQGKPLGQLAQGEPPAQRPRARWLTLYALRTTYDEVPAEHAGRAQQIPRLDRAATRLGRGPPVPAPDGARKRRAPMSKLLRLVSAPGVLALRFHSESAPFCDRLKSQS